MKVNKWILLWFEHCLSLSKSTLRVGPQCDSAEIVDLSGGLWGMNALISRLPLDLDFLLTLLHPLLPCSSPLLPLSFPILPFLFFSHVLPPCHAIYPVKHSMKQTRSHCSCHVLRPLYPWAKFLCKVSKSGFCYSKSSGLKIDVWKELKIVPGTQGMHDKQWLLLLLAVVDKRMYYFSLSMSYRKKCCWYVLLWLS